MYISKSYIYLSKIHSKYQLRISTNISIAIIMISQFGIHVLIYTKLYRRTSDQYPFLNLIV